MVVLLLHVLSDYHEFLYDLDSLDLFFEFLEQLFDGTVEVVLIHILVAKGLKCVIVEGRPTKLFQHSQLPLHIPDILFLEVQLYSLVAELNEDVIEHDVLHQLMSGDVECNNLPVSELLTDCSVICHTLLEGNERTSLSRVRFSQVNEQGVKLADRYESSCIFIIH